MDRFNTVKLYAHLDAYRNRHGHTWREIADETGVPLPTITALNDGHRPDYDTLLMLTHWSETSVGTFMEPRTPPIPERAHRRRLIRMRTRRGRSHASLQEA